MKVYTKEYSGKCNSVIEALLFMDKCINDFFDNYNKKESKNDINFDDLPIPEKVKM